MRKFEFVSTPLWTILGRSGGLLVPFFIALWYGAGAETDAFFLAYGLLVSLGGLFNPIFESLLVPYLTEHKQDPKRAASLSGAILWNSLPAIVVVFLIAGFLLPVFLKRWSGLDDASSHLTARLFFEMTPLFVSGVLIAASNGVFYTHKIFWFPALSPAVRFVTVLVILLAAHSAWGIHAVTAGHAAGEILRGLIGLAVLWQLSLWRLPMREESHVGITRFFSHFLSPIAALLALNLIPVTNQWFASWFGAGKLSLLNYADRLFQIPYQLFLTGMLQIFLSYWSDDYHEQVSALFWQRVKRDIATASKMALALSLLLFFVRGQAVRLVFGTSGLVNEELEVLAKLFGWLILGFPPAVLGLLCVRVIFVMKKTAVFCFQSWAKLALHILFNYVLSRFLGLEGIAISTALVSLVVSLALYFYLRRHWQKREAVAP